MAETTSAPSLRELSEAATPGEWRMRKHFISAPSTNPVIPGEDVVFSVAYSDRSHDEDNRNLAFAARLVSDYRAGRLIDPTTLTEAVAAARAEGWKPIKTAPYGRPILIGRWTKPKAGPPAWDAQVFVIESPNWREDFDWIDDEPTHWCEMAPPPTTPGGRTALAERGGAE